MEESDPVIIDVESHDFRQLRHLNFRGNNRDIGLKPLRVIPWVLNLWIVNRHEIMGISDIICRAVGIYVYELEYIIVCNGSAFREFDIQM